MKPTERVEGTGAATGLGGNACVSGGGGAFKDLAGDFERLLDGSLAEGASGSKLSFVEEIGGADVSPETPRGLFFADSISGGCATAGGVSSLSVSCIVLEWKAANS